MEKEKTHERYLDYLMIYTNTILEYSEELKSKCKKKSSGEVKINWAKCTYFGTSKWVTVINKKNYLEMSFPFNADDKFVFFYKSKFHNYIESDLNALWLWKKFSSNSIIREKEFEECFDNLCNTGMLSQKDNWFIILINEISN